MANCSGGCGACEGQIHAPGCDMEMCPFCGGQLMSCGCIYRKFYADVYDPKTWNHEKKCFEGHPTNGLPEDVYKDGPPGEVLEKWKLLLEEKGLIPYIRYPNICCHCGLLGPSMFFVPDEEWNKYVEPAMREKMLCRACYDWIKNQIDTNGG